MGSEQLSKDENKAIEKVIDKATLEVNKAQAIEKAYKIILSQKPPKSIVKHHSYGKFDYLPITAVERLLDGLFPEWHPEILREGYVINGFYVVVRVTAKLPQSDKVLTADGIGFAEFQTAKGSKPTDFTQLMPSAGVLAVPKAKAEAIKNAVKSFGDLFGRNLARNDDQADIEAEFVNASRSKVTKALEAKNETDSTD